MELRVGEGKVISIRSPVLFMSVLVVLSKGSTGTPTGSTGRSLELILTILYRYHQYHHQREGLKTLHGQVLW